MTMLFQGTHGVLEEMEVGGVCQVEEVTHLIQVRV